MTNSRNNIYVYLPLLGRVERAFHNKGEAVAYLKKQYGAAYARLRPRFESASHDKRSYINADFSGETI